jgi:putative acetyltransferase
MWTIGLTWAIPGTGSLAGVVIEPRPAADPELAALLAEQQAELRSLDGGVDGVVYPLDPSIEYLVLVLDGMAVGCGALQRLGAGTAEIKRMYTSPAYRRRGFSRRMLAALEQLALDRGCAVVRLETGTYMPAAMGLYRAAGYAEIPPYGEYAGNPFSVCFERLLGDAQPYRDIQIK